VIVAPEPSFWLAGMADQGPLFAPWAVSAAESIAPSATGPWTGRPRATTDQKGSLSCSSFRSLPADNEGCRLPAREATEFLQRQLPATGPLPSISAMSAASSTVASISALRIDTLSTLNP